MRFYSTQAVDWSKPAHFTRSVFGRIEIILYRVEEDMFRVECWRSFAEYAFGMRAEGAEDASL